MDYQTDTPALQRLFHRAEDMALGNIRQFADYKVLVEEAYYPNVWLKPQPMGGGELYAKRNLEVALSNQLIFMDHQREDGRLPGMVEPADGEPVPRYGWFQGCCFPTPAFKLYYRIIETLTAMPLEFLMPP